MYQYIKILTVCTCLCVCVCVTEVGCSWGGTRLVTRDLRTTEPRTPRRMFENVGHVGTTALRMFENVGHGLVGSF